MSNTQNTGEQNTSMIKRLLEQSLGLSRNNPHHAMQMADEALVMATDLLLENEMAEALSVKGVCKVWAGNYDIALKYLFDALPVLQRHQNKVYTANTYYHIFCAFFFLANYESAFKYANDMLEIAEQEKDKESYANALNAIGTIHYTTHENEKALEILSKALEIAIHIENHHIIARIMDGLGSVYLNLKDFKRSIDYKKKTLQAAHSLGSKYVEAFALDGLAKNYLASGDFAYAEKHFHECLLIRCDIQFKAGIAETNFQLGDLYLSMNRMDYALNYLTSALSISEEIESKDITYKAHEALSRLYEKKADIVKFIHHFKHYSALKEDYFSEKNQQQLNSVEMQINILQIEKEKKLLNEKNLQLEKQANDLIALSNLGKTITSLLSVEAINKKAFHILSQLMDIHGFGIGIISENGKALNFPGYIEKGIVLHSSSYDLANQNRLASVCFVKELDIIINDFDEDAGNFIEKRLHPVMGLESQSIIYLPLKINDKKLGVITVQSFHKHAFDGYNVSFVRNLAIYCAIAIENAKLYEKLEERVKERTNEVTYQKEKIEKSQVATRQLNIIGQQIISNVSFDLIFEKLHQNVSLLMNADIFSVRIYHKDKQNIEYRYSIEDGEIKEPIFVSMSDTNNYSVWCVENKKEIFINDHILEYTKYTEKIVIPRGSFPQSLLFCPMFIGNEVTGVITVQSHSKNKYRPYHMDALRTLSNYTAIALENANLVEHLEEKVNNRTIEVVIQKEKIEKSLRDNKLLSEIGKEITSTFSVDDIISKVYEQINTLMDATVFGIGLFRPDTNDLFFLGVMEKGEKLAPCAYSLEEDIFSSKCFLTKQEIKINDLEKEYKYFITQDYDALQGEVPESMMYMPLYAKEKPLGVITVQSFSKHSYNEAHLDLLRSLSVYVGSAIENANLYKSLEDRVIERTSEVLKQKEEIEKSHQATRLLSELGQHIISDVSMDSIFSKLHENINRFMRADRFGVRIYYPKRQQIEYKYEIENDLPQEPQTVSMDNESDFSVWCIKNKKEIFINDALNEYQHYTKKILPKNNILQSLLFCPMMIGSRVVGVITVQSADKNAYSPLHLDILKTLGTYTAIAVENANLVETLEEKVNDRTREVIKQKEIIEESNKHMTDSIKYAKRIQEAFLPTEESFTSLLKDAFVIYKPKDIVSGDFYWIEKKGNKILFAVVDCTGHGVPGAFMSIIGFNGLNQIVNEYNYTRPSEILTQLNKNVSSSLSQKVEDSKIRDGMDIAVCSIDLLTNKLEYAGAFSPLFIIRSGEIIKTKGDKHPIGNFIGEQDFEFTNHEFNLQPNDKIYIFSDGFADQFGGPNGKKLKYSAFRKLLLQHYTKPMSKQKEAIDAFFEDWKKGYDQIDDVCLIGLAVN